MNGVPFQNGAPGPIVRAQTCKNCKYREVEDGNVARCHFGPPQRSVFVVPGGRQMVQVAFPEVIDSMFCHQHRPRVLTTRDVTSEAGARSLTTI